jgi:hypothetical protein
MHGESTVAAPDDPDDRADPKAGPSCPKLTWVPTQVRGIYAGY